MATYQDYLDEAREMKEQIKTERLDLKKCVQCGDLVAYSERLRILDEWVCDECLWTKPNCPDAHFNVKRVGSKGYICLEEGCTETPFTFP